MEMIPDKELYIKQLRPGVYLTDEAHVVSGYIVTGSEKVCVIDTMYGYNNLREAVGKISDKPVIVINTHGHPDHIFGNVYFDEAYLNPKDHDLALSFINNPEFIRRSQEYGLVMPEFKEIRGGDKIDLGGKTLEIYDLPGHTPGGILLLLKEDRILFTGDSVNHHLWMMLEGCLELSDYVKELDKVMFLEKEADYILHGHARDFDDISLMRCMKRGIEDICNGNTSEDKPYEWSGGKAMQHSFSLEEGKQYSQTESVICYNPKEQEKVPLAAPRL